MNCPVCQTGMTTMEYEGATVHTCESCGGEYIGAETLRHIVNTREQRFDEALQQEWGGLNPQFGQPAKRDSRHLACPACGGAMSVQNYCGDTGVSVDRCDECSGMWLDQMELERVQVLLERWADEAPAQIQAIAGELEATRRETAERLSNTFAGSRFAFVNALINRFLDAA
ncbi:MAG: zf-TFIIB domain-containing protein [Planctomycetota bacterium]|jgi:Zn-finger nucleic acid-binding protein